MKRLFFLLWIICVGTLFGTTIELTLKKCRQMALLQNEAVQSAQEQKQSAHAARKASYAQFFPHVNATGGYTYVNKPIQYTLDLPVGDYLQGMEQANPDVTSDPFFQTLQDMNDQGAIPDEFAIEIGENDNWLVDITLTQPLFTGGKILNQYRISRATEGIAESNLIYNESKIIYQTDEAYWRLMNVSAKKELAEDYMIMIQHLLEDVQNAFDVGMATQNDILKVQVKLNEAEVMLLQARNGVTLSMMALNQVIGEPFDTTIQLADSSFIIVPVEYDSTQIEEYIQDRPEIKMLNQQLGIKGSLTNIAESSFYPNIMLQASQNWIYPNAYDSFESEFGDNWQVGIAFQWQLFDLNERFNTVSAARHEEKASQLTLQQNMELVALDIRQAALQYDEAQKRIELSEHAVAQAAENLNMTRNRYEEGMETLSDVLQAQVSWMNAKSEQIEARTNMALHSSNLARALGQLHRGE